MMNNQFCHLHVHNEYSYLDGYGSAKAYISKAKKLGFKYIALTNHGNIDGLLQWQQQCDTVGIHSILGCEAYIVPDRFVKQKEKRGHIVLLVKNEIGWKTLCSILTQASLTGFYYKPRIDYNLLINSDLSGLIILTACVKSFLDFKDSTKILSQQADIYFEIMPHNFKEQHLFHNLIKKLSKQFPNIPFVATNDCHYIESDEWESQEMLLAINTKAKWNDPKRWKFGVKGLYLKTEQEMFNSFQEQNDFDKKTITQAMSNTIKIAEQCFEFKIPKQKIYLPNLHSLTKNEELSKMDNICRKNSIRIKHKWNQNYHDRYLQEMELIRKKNFEAYFLIVYDLVNWARNNDILVGVGRGSVGGSLVSYLMNITQVDPIEFKLSFYRFINEYRIDYPDIDIDFEKRYRGKIIEYLEQTYGKYNVCGISTDMKMQSKSAIRDVCRVMDIPYPEVNAFVNLIWQKDEKNIQTCIDVNQRAKQFAKKYPKVIELALKMEGQCRGSGAHAAAIIISAINLSDSDKCILIKRNDKLVCNWNMRDSEYMGLMKLDILGLSTLSVLSEAKKLITNFDFNEIPLNDKMTLKNISNGETVGLFQLSGYACTDVCKRMGVSSFEDVVSVLSLARPGPADSGMTEEYILRKNGKKWKKLHPIYEEVTKDTFGLLVYQEQVIQVISKVAGMDESTADKIRKIIAKQKSNENFQLFWEEFRDGCKRMKTLTLKEAEDFWNGLLKWSSYGFNRSHAVAYSLISYWTAYLKTHYSKEFFISSLSYNEWNEKSNDKNKHKNSLLLEVKQKGITIMPPKQQHSDVSNWKYHDNKIYCPFIEITGIGENNVFKLTKNNNKNQGFFKTHKIVNTKIDLMKDELEIYNPTIIPSKKILSKYIPHINFD